MASLMVCPALGQPASEAWLQPGATILANPMGLPDSYYPALVVRYNADSETYLIRFTSGPYAVGKGEYVLSASKLRPAPAAAAAPQPSAPPPAPAAPPPAARVTANPPATPPTATTEKKQGETTWEGIWREREAAIAAQQQQAGQPAGKVAGSYPFQGIYLRHEQSFQGTALNYREDHYYFFPDGRVYHDVPPEGPARFDWNKAMQVSPELCGYYGVNGNEITFSWPGGGYTWVLKKNGGGYEMNYSPTVKVETFPANARLSGTYERGDITAAAGAPTLSTAFSYTFSPDGTVLLNEMKGTDSTNLTTTVRDQNRGTYTVAGNDMEIRTGAGVWRFTAYPQWNNGPPSQAPSRISLDGALLERRR